MLSVGDTHGNIEGTKGPDLPSWVKGAAKLLNGGSEGQDWTALAKRLGYKKNKTEKFNDDLNPGLALIADWIVSSGNTSLSVDMLVMYLEQMQRDDIVEIIQRGQGGCSSKMINLPRGSVNHNLLNSFILILFDIQRHFTFSQAIELFRVNLNEC